VFARRAGAHHDDVEVAHVSTQPLPSGSLNETNEE
jgi:hypothetical protein